MNGKSRVFDIWMFLLVVVLAGFFAYATHKQDVYAGMSALRLLPEPTPFTELYFIDPTNLPKKMVSKGTLSFAFGIHNEEGATTTYPYQVYLEYPTGQRESLVQGTVALGQNASTTVHVKHILPILDLKTDAVVELVTLGQRIAFHLESAQ